MIYKCIKVTESGVPCDGQVNFCTVKKSDTSSSGSKKSKRFQMILEVKDEISACPKCGTSYFEWELKST